jgi:hypothetical protein
MLVHKREERTRTAFRGCSRVIERNKSFSNQIPGSHGEPVSQRRRETFHGMSLGNLKSWVKIVYLNSKRISLL